MYLTLHIDKLFYTMYDLNIKKPIFLLRKEQQK